MTDTTTAGVSRRDLLKKSVVAGSLVWVAPTVMASPASALTFGACADCPPGRMYGLRFQSGGCSSGINTNNCLHCPPNNCANIPAAVLNQSPNPCCLVDADLVNFQFGPGQEPNTLTVTLAPGVVFCCGAIWGGSDASVPAGCAPQCTEQQTVTAVVNNDGTTTVTMTKESGWSHGDLVVCVQGTVPPTSCPGD